MSTIRVTYSGLISFGIKLLTVITGTVFILILTRQLSVLEFGTWGLINSLIIYATGLSPVITFWVTREIARKEESGKTALLFSTVLSIVGIGIFFLASFLVGENSEVQIDILLFVTILIPPMFINNTLSAINLGYKPHSVSYGLIVFEISKILGAVIFVIMFDLGFIGAVWATFFAYITSVFVQLIYAKEKLKGRFVFDFIKKWFKFSWVPTYRTIPSVVELSDVMVFTLVTGTVGGVALFTAAKTVGNLVNHTRAFSKAVYPKLLEGGPKKHLEQNLNQLFYFAIPIMAFSITFAKPALFALNPLYESAWLVIIILTVRSLLTTINRIFYMSLQGIEKVDMEKNSSFKDFAKSKLMFFPTIDLIRNGVYFGSLAIIFFIFKGSPEIELVNMWVLVGLVIEIPLFAYIYSLTSRNFPITIEKASFVKYLVASFIAFGIVHILMLEYLNYVNQIFKFLPQIIIFATIAIGVYFAITFVIDKKTRNLVYAIINEVRKNYQKG